ncbi:MAG: type II toxin-antitoxin system RatA family toxin [Rickettsiales bacterium]|nr:type II toxin-antitoxin system RatA family toxin [Rickettsiales bacterium]
MPSLTEKKILPYSAKQIYSLVMDIEKYPEFLPWCKQAKIIEVKSDENLIADLLINFKNFFEKYRSDVKHGIDENGDYFVDVVAIEGPFKYLSNKWKFKKMPDSSSCEIEFFIEFQFNSFILEKMLGGIFEKATHKMMFAFEERAKVVFI